MGEGQGEGSAEAPVSGHARAQRDKPNLTPAGTVLWPLTDHLGTVRDLARYNPDTDRTTIVNHLTYDAFGRVTGQSNPAVTTLFAFTGRPLDPATGLQNHLHRWYDPAVGRWLSEDPIGFGATEANLYRYVVNGPTAFADPSGLAKKRFWRLLVRVEKETAEFVLENGQRIRIRNAQFVESKVSLTTLEKLTDVSPRTIKRLREKYGEVIITFDKYGQPDFSRFIKAKVRLDNPGASNYRDAAWEALKATDPKAYEYYRQRSDEYVWHHAADGSLQLIDKDLHTAYQHTGLNSMIKKSLMNAGLLVPGLAEFREGKISEGFREVFIEFTPLSWSMLGADLLGAFYDECYREIYGKLPDED